MIASSCIWDGLGGTTVTEGLFFVSWVKEISKMANIYIYIYVVVLGFSNRQTYTYIF
jgi:hypothetical protein